MVNIFCTDRNFTKKWGKIVQELIAAIFTPLAIVMQYLREKAWQDRPNHSTPDPQTAVVRELQQTDNDNAIFVVADQS